MGVFHQITRMDTARNKSDPFYNRSLERALQILNVFGSERKPLTLARLSEETGLSKATVLRLCSTLIKYGFLKQAPETKHYSLGLKLFELGSIVLSSFSLRKIASPHLTQLQARLRKTVFLGILAEDELLYIDKREDGAMAIGFPSSMGKRRPPHWGMLGPVLMAHLPDEETERLLEKYPLTRMTKKSCTEKEDFREKLREARRRGYAVDDEMTFESIGGIGAPVRDFTGKVVAALGVGFISASVDPKDMKKMTREVKAASDAISKELGYIDRSEDS
jgi:IclR family transcriptional regulator, KDG regulon repressor